MTRTAAARAALCESFELHRLSYMAQYVFLKTVPPRTPSSNGFGGLHGIAWPTVMTNKQTDHAVVRL